MFDYMQVLGTTVKKARQEQGFTQTKVAEYIDVDVRTILKIENCKGNPKMEVLFPLIRKLQIDSNTIFYPELYVENSALTQFQLFLSKCSTEELNKLLPICETLLSVLRTEFVTSLQNNF